MAPGYASTNARISVVFPCTCILVSILDFRIMGLRVLGVGLGVFLIAFIWFVALVLSLFFHRIRTIFTLAFTGAAAVLSAILLAIPLDYRGITPQTDSLTTETPQVTFQFFNNSTFFSYFVYSLDH